MVGMTIANIVKACGGEFIGDDELLTMEVSQIVTDSRQASEGSLFIAIKGERVDGHNFIEQVMDAGAMAVICEKRPANGKNYILVQSSIQAIKDLGAFYRRNLNIPFVGITGSVGKTSTKEMIASVLAQKFNVLKTAGNFNNEIGLPFTIFRIRPEHEIAVVEMGISGFGEMNRLGHIAKPDVAVMTNIGTCHLENLKDRDGVLKAKSEVLVHLNTEGVLVCNGDDDKLVTIESVNGQKPIRFGLDDNHDIYAKNIKSQGLKGMDCRIVTPNGEIDAHIPMPGVHMVYNALAATAVGLHFGLTLEQIQTGIASIESVSGRLNLMEANGYTVVDDCYNANPISMKASVDVLDMADTRKVAILGDMFELGENEKMLHYEVGSHCADKSIDVLIGIGQLAKEIVAGMQETSKKKKNQDSDNKAQNCEIHYFETKEKFFEQADNILQKGDTILVKASHGMHFEEIVQTLTKENA